MNPERMLQRAAWKRDIEMWLSIWLKTLTPREEFVIIRRFGLCTEHTQTLRQIGAELPRVDKRTGGLSERQGISAEQVRQLERRALRKLRRRLELAEERGEIVVPEARLG